MDYFHLPRIHSIPDSLSRNKKLVLELQQVQRNRRQDPVARELAKAVLDECEEAKRKRQRISKTVIVLLILAMLFSIICAIVARTMKSYES